MPPRGFETLGRFSPLIVGRWPGFPLLQVTWKVRIFNHLMTISSSNGRWVSRLLVDVVRDGRWRVYHRRRELAPAIAASVLCPWDGVFEIGLRSGTSFSDARMDKSRISHRSSFPLLKLFRRLDGARTC